MGADIQELKRHQYQAWESSLRQTQFDNRVTAGMNLGQAAFQTYPIFSSLLDQVAGDALTPVS